MHRQLFQNYIAFSTNQYCLSPSTSIFCRLFAIPQARNSNIETTFRWSASIQYIRRFIWNTRSHYEVICKVGEGQGSSGGSVELGWRVVRRSTYYIPRYPVVTGALALHPLNCLQIFNHFRGFFSGLSYLADPAKFLDASSKSGQNWPQMSKICPDRIAHRLNRHL